MHARGRGILSAVWQWLLDLAKWPVERLASAFGRLHGRKVAIDDWRKEAQLEVARCVVTFSVGAAILDETEESKMRLVISEIAKRIAGMDRLEVERLAAKHAPVVEAIQLDWLRVALATWKARLESVTLGEAFVEGEENMELARAVRENFPGLQKYARDLYLRLGGDPKLLEPPRGEGAAGAAAPAGTAPDPGTPEAGGPSGPA